MPRISLIGIAILLHFAMACSFQNPPTDVRINGSQIIMDAGRHHIEGILEPESTYEYLLKGEGYTFNVFAGDAFAVMLPRDTAAELQKISKSFFKCGDPAVCKVIQNMQHCVLVGNGDKTKSKITETLDLMKRSSIPVVIFNASRIKVTKQTYKDMEYEDRTGTIFYFITKLTILKPDYLQ